MQATLKKSRKFVYYSFIINCGHHLLVVLDIGHSMTLSLFHPCGWVAE